MSYEILELLKDEDISFEENIGLDKLSYIRAGGSASLSASPDTLRKLCTLTSYLAEAGMPYKVIGRMSNTMSHSGLYEGVIIKTDKLTRKYEAENCVSAECGVKLSELLWSCARRGLGGGEELFLIPASVGGAVYNNAGAHGRCIADIISSCDVYLPKERKRVTLSASEMCLGYRESFLKNNDAVLLDAKFSFVYKSFLEIKARITECAKIRRASQPLEYPSLGSVFKRHEGVGAGYYIERAGLKGKRIGGAEVSRKHAGFIINVGGATPEDICELISEVKNCVFDTFGIMLEEEIEII